MSAAETRGKRLSTLAAAIVESLGEKVSEAWAGLSRRQRIMRTRRDLRRREKQEKRAAFLAAPGVSGYCCPRCHRWLPTPEARRECRLSHREAA